MILTLSPKAEKQIKKLSGFNRIIINTKLKEFDKHHKNGKKLIGYSNVFRVRSGKYRIVYRYVNYNFYIEAIELRNSVYNNLGKIIELLLF